MKNFTALMIGLLICSGVYAQQKFERESRIKENEVPDQAIDFVQNLFEESTRVKWYREENLDGIAIEGKTKRDEGVYSVKFSADGDLYDVELTQDFQDLPEDAQEEIEEYLSENYHRYRIKKVQVQWSGDADQVGAFVRHGKTKEDIETRYEIEFTGRKDRKTVSFEGLFDHEGEHLETKEIVPRNISHLLY